MRRRAASSTVACLLFACYGGVADDEVAEVADNDSIIDGSHGSVFVDSTDGGSEDPTTDDGATTTDDGATTTDGPTTSETDATTTETTSETDATTTTGGAEGCSPDALELIDLLNAYRAENNLPAIPASPSMCMVSTAHVHDLADNSPHTQPGGCNLHSWSAQGPWSPCCYTPDHAQAQCMWDKPTQLTVYPGYGYENAASGVSSPAQALELWKSSPPHNEVILNLGIWASHPWQAIGADIHQGFGVLWFGEQVDPG